MGILAAAVGGAGEGAMRAGHQLGEYAGRSALQKEMNDFVTARDARLEEYTRGREERGYEQQSKLQKASFAHAEGMQQNQLDFQQIENFLTREQQSSESQLNRDSAEKIARLSRESAERIASGQGVVQVGEGGKILWVGRGGEVTDTGYTSQKDLSPSAKVAADILRDQLKAIDKSESEGMADPARTAQQRRMINGQLLAVLTGDLDKAFGGGNAFAGRTGYDVSSKTVYVNGEAIGTADNEAAARALVTQHRSGAKAEPKVAPSLLNSEVASAQQQPDFDSMVKPSHRGGDFYIDVPSPHRGQGESPLSSLRGRTFKTREDAVRALAATYGYAE